MDDPPYVHTAEAMQTQLSQNVRAIRSRLGVTQEELAHRAGLNPRHLQKLEAGDINPTLSTIAQLAYALGIEAYELLRMSNPNINCEARHDDCGQEVTGP